MLLLHHEIIIDYWPELGSFINQIDGDHKVLFYVLQDLQGYTLNFYRFQSTSDCTALLLIASFPPPLFSFLPPWIKTRKKGKNDFPLLVSLV